MGVYDKETQAYGLDGMEIWRLQGRNRGEGPFTLYARGSVLPPVLWVRESLLEGVRELE